VKFTIQIIAFIVGLVILQKTTFTVEEYEQAIVLQLGRILEGPVKEPGLHFMMPFVNEVRVFDKRILQWDGAAGEVPTRDKKFIWVDTTARWQIEDPVLFYKSVPGEKVALGRIGSIIDGATKDVISSYNLIEAVRNSNTIFQDIKDRTAALQTAAKTDEEDLNAPTALDDVESITQGREKLSEMIAKRAGDVSEHFSKWFCTVPSPNKT
jgi:membrane protease subunit HflC